MEPLKAAFERAQSVSTVLLLLLIPNDIGSVSTNMVVLLSLWKANHPVSCPPALCGSRFSFTNHRDPVFPQRATAVNLLIEAVPCDCNACRHWQRAAIARVCERP